MSIHSYLRPLILWHLVLFVPLVLVGAALNDLNGWRKYPDITADQRLSALTISKTEGGFDG